MLVIDDAGTLVGLESEKGVPGVAFRAVAAGISSQQQLGEGDMGERMGSHLTIARDTHLYAAVGTCTWQTLAGGSQRDLLYRYLYGRTM